MILEIKNKGEFISRFLTRLHKVDNSCMLNLSKDGASSLLSAADNTVILYSQYAAQLDIEGEMAINIPDLGRLIKILQCIDTDEIVLEIAKNQIQYESRDIRFKYHLLDDGILASPPVSVNKIKQTVKNCDISFTLPFSALISLIKGSTFSIDISKVYFFTQSDGVYAEIDDKTRHNVDSVCIRLCNEYKGASITTPLPLSFETIRILAGSKCININVFVNTKLNVLTFEINNDNIKNIYIVSGLSK